MLNPQYYVTFNLYSKKLFATIFFAKTEDTGLQPWLPLLMTGSKLTHMTTRTVVYVGHCKQSGPRG